MATPTAFVHVISYSFWGTCCCHYNSFNIISQWFIKENFWMILVWMMTVMITTRSSCKARTTGKQQSHSRSPYSPIKKHQQRVCSFLSALERVLDLIPKQKNKSMSCLSVRWRCLCCLVKLSGLWRIGGNEWQKKRRNMLNQESDQIHCFIHVPTGSILFRQQQQQQQKKQDWFHFDTWINTCFMALL